MAIETLCMDHETNGPVDGSVTSDVDFFATLIADSGLDNDMMTLLFYSLADPSNALPTTEATISILERNISEYGFGKTLLGRYAASYQNRGIAEAILNSYGSFTDMMCSLVKEGRISVLKDLKKNGYLENFEHSDFEHVAAVLFSAASSPDYDRTDTDKEHAKKIVARAVSYSGLRSQSPDSDTFNKENWAMAEKIVRHKDLLPEAREVYVILINDIIKRIIQEDNADQPKTPDGSSGIQAPNTADVSKDEMVGQIRVPQELVDLVYHRLVYSIALDRLLSLGSDIDLFLSMDPSTKTPYLSKLEGVLRSVQRMLIYRADSNSVVEQQLDLVFNNLEESISGANMVGRKLSIWNNDDFVRVEEIAADIAKQILSIYLEPSYGLEILKHKLVRADPVVTVPKESLKDMYTAVAVASFRQGVAFYEQINMGEVSVKKSFISGYAPVGHDGLERLLLSRLGLLAPVRSARALRALKQINKVWATAQLEYLTAVKSSGSLKCNSSYLTGDVPLSQALEEYAEHLKHMAATGIRTSELNRYHAAFNMHLVQYQRAA